MVSVLVVETIIFFVILGIWWYLNDRWKYSKYPPGPFRLPIIGNIVQLLMYGDNSPAETYKKLSNVYGDVMFIKLGQHDAVVFSSLDSVQNMLTSDKTAARYQYEFVKDRQGGKNLGVIWSFDKPWQNLRRFTIRNLRDFGFGKSSTMDVVINNEITKFHDFLKEEVEKSKDGIIHVNDLFTMTMVNVMWVLVAGKSFELNDPKILRWVQLNRDWVTSIMIGMDMSDPFPFLRDWFPNWSGRTNQMKISKELYDYGKKLLDEQRKPGALNQSDPETFIDAFNRKIDDSKSDPNTDFTDDQFIITILDLFLAGSETSSNSLNFGILYMMLYPEVQKKVQREIDQVVPNDLPIDSTMKSKLPYTSATILEILRYSTVIPMPTSRAATEDFYFQGHLIRKGTALMFNLQAVHFDEKLWGDPLNFRPERFLNPEGTGVNQKIADQLKTFGSGKRYCLGQSLAEMTMFLYFASTLRKFEFAKVAGTNPTSEPVLGLTLSPRPYDIRVKERCCLNSVTSKSG